jgi:hypothetical protein
MKVIAPEMVTLWSDNQKAAQAANRQRREATKARFAPDKLARESDLTTARKYRLCGDGCGLVLLWANPGYHPTAEDLSPGPATAHDWMDETVVGESPAPSLRPAVSVSQVRWARDMIAQFPLKPKEQICRENGGIPWEQLQHYAQSDTKGLPERKGQRTPTPKAEAKPVEKPVKAKSSKKVKGA